MKKIGKSNTYLLFIALLQGGVSSEGQAQESFSPFLQSKLSQDYERVMAYGSQSLQEKMTKILKENKALRRVKKEVLYWDSKKSFWQKNKENIWYGALWGACTLLSGVWFENFMSQEAKKSSEASPASQPTVTPLQWSWGKADIEIRDKSFSKMVENRFKDKLDEIKEKGKKKKQSYADKLEISISDDYEKEKKEAKRAYHKLSLSWHPDRNPSPKATKKFQKILDAYEFFQKTLEEQEKELVGSDVLRPFLSFCEPDFPSSYPYNQAAKFLVLYPLMGWIVSLPLWYVGSSIYKYFQSKKLEKEFNESYFEKLQQNLKNSLYII